MMSEASFDTRTSVASIWRRASWFALQVLLVLLSFMSFFIWAPWLGAQPISEAAPDIRELLPPECPAFTANHGHYACFVLGTAKSHPWGPVLGILLSIASISAAAWIDYSRRGLSCRPFALLMGDFWERINFGPKDGK